MRNRFLAVPHFARDRQIGIDDLGHALFDLGEIVGREWFLAREVVIEAVLHRGADRHLRAGKQFLHRLRQHMRRIVAQHFEAVGRVAHDQFELCVRFDCARQIPPGAVELGGDHLLGQRFGNTLSGRKRRHAIVILAHRAIGKCKGDGHVGSFAPPFTGALLSAKHETEGG